VKRKIRRGGGRSRRRGGEPWIHCAPCSIVTPSWKNEKEEEGKEEKEEKERFQGEKEVTEEEKGTKVAFSL